MSVYAPKRQPEGERSRMPQPADDFSFVSEDLEKKIHYAAPVARS
jgi:hypothetical protein